MKSYLLALSFILITASITVDATAKATPQATPAEKKGVLMKVDFQFKTAKKSFQVKHDSIIAEDNKHWTPLAPAQDGVALLGKTQKQKDGSVKIEGMVVDTSVNPVQVQSMTIITKLGETASITSATETDKVTMTLTPELTTYTEKAISK